METNNKVKPQHELEWLANNVSTWQYDHKKFIYRNETLVSFHPIYSSEESNYLNGYTKQQWQECRYKLGLDDRPIEEVKMLDLSGAVVGEQFEISENEILEFVYLSKNNTFCMEWDDGSVSMYDVNGKNKRNGTDIVKKHDTRPWLSHLPDAGLFSSTISALEFDRHQ